MILKTARPAPRLGTRPVHGPLIRIFCPGAWRGGSAFHLQRKGRDGFFFPPFLLVARAEGGSSSPPSSNRAPSPSPSTFHLTRHSTNSNRPIATKVSIIEPKAQAFQQARTARQRSKKQGATPSHQKSVSAAAVLLAPRALPSPSTDRPHPANCFAPPSSPVRDLWMAAGGPGHSARGRGRKEGQGGEMGLLSALFAR